MRALTRGVIAALVTLALPACGDGGGVMEDAAVVLSPTIQAVRTPTPVVAGSPVVVRGNDFDLFVGAVALRVEVDGETMRLDELTVDGEGWASLGLAELSANERVFDAATLVDRLGAGSFDALVTIEGSVDSLPFETSFDVADSLPLALDEGLTGDVHRNDAIVLHGEGFLAPSEGSLTLRVVGDFVARGETTGTTIDVRLPVHQLELSSRERAEVVLSTELGGVRPGTLRGTAHLERELGGRPTMTTEMPVDLRFGTPELYSFDGASLSVGRLIAVRGAGFLGGTDDETTLFAVQGTFTAPGESAVPLMGDLVPRFVSGTELRLPVELAIVDDRVIARFFGAERGVFEGTATPVVIAGTDEVRGSAVPLRLELGPRIQIVQLRFLPGWYASLARFGLATAADRVAARIEERIEGIYAAYGVDVRLERPTDYDPTAVTIVEIGGPDPNGNGLFGYDNSPGKDVGNLRMADAIGGANAATQADGYPGYGGVFVESMLYWSSHPDLPGERPPSSPEPDPLFDEIFDPVRMSPATRDEVLGMGDAARVDAVEHAIFALGSIVGETTSHELGHSLGMAQPYGSLTAFHNSSDGEGCLMDTGGARTIGERAAEPGYPETRFCYDEPNYLASILGTE